MSIYTPDICKNMKHVGDLRLLYAKRSLTDAFKVRMRDKSMTLEVILVDIGIVSGIFTTQIYIAGNIHS